MMSQNDTADGWRTLPVVGWHVQTFGSYVPVRLAARSARARRARVGAAALASGALPPARARADPRLEERHRRVLVTVGTVGHAHRSVACGACRCSGRRPGGRAECHRHRHHRRRRTSRCGPRGRAQPTASNLNWPAGDTRPNLVVAKLGAQRRDLDLQPVGHHQRDRRRPGLVRRRLRPDRRHAGRGVTHVRVLDSRDGTGGFSTPWAARHASATSPSPASHGVPADADAVLLNVTVTDTTAPSYLTVWPAGQTQPTAPISTGPPATPARTSSSPSSAQRRDLHLQPWAQPM